MQPNILDIEQLKSLNRDKVTNKFKKAVIFNISCLAGDVINDGSLLIACNVIKNKIEKNSYIYVLPRGDLAIIVDDTITDASINNLTYEIQYLFSDDIKQAASTKDLDFFTIFDLEKNWFKFFQTCQNKITNNNFQNLEQYELIAKEKKSINTKVTHEDINNNRLSLYDNILHEVETILDQINFDDIFELRLIYLIQNQEKKTMFTELYIHQDVLHEILINKIDIADNPNLMSFIKECIDIRCLTKLLNIISEEKIKGYLYTKISLNTLISEDFDIFHKSLSDNLRSSLIIGIHISDIYKNILQYHQIVNYLTDQGYKISIWGVDYKTFMFTDRNHLKADLLEVDWDDNLKQSDKAVYDSIKSKLQLTGASRVIMSSCNDNIAQEICNSMGFILYG